MIKFKFFSNFQEERKYYSFEQTASLITEFSEYIKDETKNLIREELLNEIFKGEEDPHVIVRKCRQDLDANPGDHVANNQLGKAYLMKEKINIASRQFKKALEIDPDYQEALFFLMITYYIQDKLEQAGEILARLKPVQDHVRFYIEGAISYNNEQIDKAIEAFKKSIRINSNFVLPYIQMASIYSLEGNLESSIEFYKKALRVIPDNIIISINLTFNFFLCGEIQTAMDIINKLRGLNPLSPSVNFACGFFLFQGEMYSDALEYYNKAIELLPGNHFFYNALGFLYYSKDEFKKAWDYYLKAVDVKYDYVDVYINLGFSYQMAGEFENALKYYREAISIDNRHSMAYYNMGAIFKLKEKYDEAIDCYNKVIALDPETAYGYAGLSICYMEKWLETQKIDRSLLTICQDNINHALKIDGSLLSPRLIMGMIYLENENFLEGVKHFETLLKNFPDFIPARVKLYESYIKLANKYYSLDKIDLAIQFFEKAYELNPDEESYIDGIQLKGAREDLISLCKIMGDICYKKSQVNKALEYYKRILELDPEDPFVHHKIGIIYELKKEFSIAMGYYKEAIKINPNFGPSYLNLGQIYKHNGNREEAVECFNKYLKFTPNGPHADDCRNYIEDVMNSPGQTGPDVDDNYESEPEDVCYEDVKEKDTVVPQQMENTWDLIAEDYRNMNRISPSDVHYGPMSMGEKELGLLGDVEGMKILELGCGGGHNSVALARLGAIVTGVDFSSEQLNFAKKLADEYGVSVEFIHGNIEDLRFLEDRKFDIVLSSFTLSYVENISQVFVEVYQVLKKAGSFVFSIEHPFMTNVMDGNFIRFNEKTYPFMKDYFYTGEEEVKWKGSNVNGKLFLYKRKIEDIINPLLGCGFQILMLLEPPVFNIEHMTPEEINNIPFFPSLDQMSYDLIKNLPYTLIIKAVSC